MKWKFLTIPKPSVTIEQQNKSTSQNCSSVLVCKAFQQDLLRQVFLSKDVLDKLLTFLRNLYNVKMHVIEKLVLPV